MNAPLPSRDDAELARQCASGEEEAARQIFRLYHGRVQATLYRVFGSNRDMDDLIQEIFLQVYRSLPSYRADAQLSTWIHRIAVRTAMRHLARRRRDPVPVAELETLDVAGDGANLDRQVAARAGVRALYAVLDELSPASRLAYVLFEIEGLSLAEVAERVGTSVTTTKLRVWRARKQVFARAKLDPHLADLVASDAEDAT